MTEFSTFDSHRRTLFGHIAGLAKIADDLQTESVRTNIRQRLENKLREDLFHLVVLGEFNRGKTSLINALIGRQVLPTGVTPTTSHIFRVRHGQSDSASIVMEDGRQLPSAVDKLSDVNADSTTSERAISRIDVTLNAPFIDQKIVLVDTPGVNDLSDHRAEITYSYIPDSDAVIFVLDAGQMLTQSERTFLREKVIAQAHDKIFFAINKWDLIAPSERPEALAYAKLQIEKMLGASYPLFPVQCHGGLDAETSGIADLERALTRFLLEKRGVVLLDHTIREALGFAALLQQGVHAKRLAATFDPDELNRKLSALETDLQNAESSIEQRRQFVKDEVTKIKASIERDVQYFATDATDKFLDDIKSATTNDLRTHFQAFMEHVVRSWVQAESTEIVAELQRVTEAAVALVAADSRKSVEELDEHLGARFPTVRIEINSMLLDMGVVASLSMGVYGLLTGSLLFGGAMLIAAPVLGAFAKGQISAQWARELESNVPKVVQSAAATIREHLIKMVDEFGQRLDSWVQQISREAHVEMVEILRALKQPSLPILKAETDNELDSRLQALTQSLNSLREQIWQQ